MNESSNAPMYDGMPSPSEPFYQTWIKALTKPNERTYAEIANSPDASPTKAYWWMALSWLVTYLVVILAATATGTTPYRSDLGSELGGSVIAMICSAPISAVVSVFFFAVDIAIIQWVAKMFKGTGSYNQLVYAVAAFAAPISLVSGLIGGLSVIPFIGLCFSILSIGLSIYILVLMVMAVKGVNGFGWGEAIGSVLLPGIVLAFVCGCLVIGILMLLGPVIGDVFSTINQSLGGY